MCLDQRSETPQNQPNCRRIDIITANYRRGGGTGPVRPILWNIQEILGIPETWKSPFEVATLLRCCFPLVLVLESHWFHCPVFQTIPMAPPQMELPDPGLAYLPWAQPLATVSTNPGVQFHMPLSMSVTTTMPQPAPPATDPELLQDPPPQLDCELPDPPLEEDTGSESGSPSLLDALLEERKAEGGGAKDSYRSSLFIPNV